MKFVYLVKYFTLSKSSVDIFTTTVILELSDDCVNNRRNHQILNKLQELGYGGVEEMPYADKDDEDNQHYFEYRPMILSVIPYK